MSSVFLVRNQHGHYLNRQQEWVDGREVQSLYRTTHRDEAVNMVFEMSVKDIALRAETVACSLNERNQPCLHRRVDAPIARSVNPESPHDLLCDDLSNETADTDAGDSLDMGAAFAPIDARPMAE